MTGSWLIRNHVGCGADTSAYENMESRQLLQYDTMLVDTSTQLHVQIHALCHSYAIQVGGSMDLNSATGVMDGLTSRNRLAARGVTTASAS